MNPADLSKRQAQEALEAYKATLAVCAYKPSPTQQRYHESLAYNRLLTAGGRGGKTTAALVDLVWCCLGIHPNRPWYGPIVAIVLCISRQNASMVVQRKLLEASELPGEAGQKPMVPADEIDWEKSASAKVPYRTFYTLAFKNGSIIHFGWSGDTHSWEKLQGIKADYVYIDENAGSEKLVIELRKRLLDVQSDPSKAPWGGCLSWGATGTLLNPTFERFREMAMSGEGDHAAFVIPPGETGAISKAVHERFALTLTKEQRKIHIDGSATSSELVRIYGKQWDDKRHMLAQDYVVRDDDCLWMGYDPGVEHPTGIVIVALSRSNPTQMKVVKCFLHARETLDYDVECIHSWFRGRRMMGVVYDYSMKNRNKNGSAPLLVDFMSKLSAKGYDPVCGYIPADKRHTVGINTVREYLDPHQFDKTVTPKLVVNPSIESGGPELRNQMLMYRGREETGFQGAGGVIKKDDDLVDPLRYLARVGPSWNKAAVCGPFKFHVDQPLASAPTLIPVDPAKQSAADRRADQSKTMAKRNRASVFRQFSRTGSTRTAVFYG